MSMPRTSSLMLTRPSPLQSPVQGMLGVGGRVRVRVRVNVDGAVGVRVGVFEGTRVRV